MLRIHLLIHNFVYGTPQFSSVQSLSCARLFATPWIAARQASLSITNSRSSLRLMFIESVMPSSHLILCHPLLLPRPKQKFNGIRSLWIYKLYTWTHIRPLPAASVPHESLHPYPVSQLSSQFQIHPPSPPPQPRQSGFPGGLVRKESTWNAGDWPQYIGLGSIPGSGRSPGEGNGYPLQYSCPGNPMDRGVWWATVHGVTRVGHNLDTKPPPPTHPLFHHNPQAATLWHPVSQPTPAHFTGP